MIDIKAVDKDHYIFTLSAEGGNVLLKSIVFQNKKEAKKMVRSLGAIQQKRSVFERRTNHKGEFLFHLKNLKGEVIGSSESFSSEPGMENGIKNLKKRIVHLSNQEEL
jgi:hypothetical protein